MNNNLKEELQRIKEIMEVLNEQLPSVPQLSDIGLSLPTPASTFSEPSCKEEYTKEELVKGLVKWCRSKPNFNKDAGNRAGVIHNDLINVSTSMITTGELKNTKTTESFCGVINNYYSKGWDFIKDIDNKTLLSWDNVYESIPQSVKTDSKQQKCKIRRTSFDA
jgi:hypothetical protein